MLLRCTTKMLPLLGVRPAARHRDGADRRRLVPELLWIERRKCLLFTHAGTLFPIFLADARKVDLLPIGPYAVSLIEEHLRSEGLAWDELGSLHPDDVQLAKTANRSVLGVMNDAAFLVRYRIAAMGGINRAEIDIVNSLRRTPHRRAGGCIRPIDSVNEPDT